MSPSERYPFVIFSAVSSTETSDDDDDADGEELEAPAACAAAQYADAGDDRHSMLKHFFMGVGEEPTCSCTPNSLTTPGSLSILRCPPPHVLELCPLFPQLEHFLAMRAGRWTAQETRNNSVESR
jgi:hypothetical protein